MTPPKFYYIINYTDFCIKVNEKEIEMKKRINLTIDENIYKNLKKIAIDENVSVSSLIEKIALLYMRGAEKNDKMGILEK